MGGGGSKGDGKTATAKKSRNVVCHKLLLLGAGGCGKSTIFKAAQLSAEAGLGDETRVYVAKKMLLELAHQLCYTVRPLLGEGVGTAEAWATAEESKDTRKAGGITASSPLPESLAPALRELWGLAEIKEAAGKGPCQSPSDPTRDMEFATYKVNSDLEFKFIDIGGQRKERIKWDKAKALDITAVIVVAALDDYSKNLAEDATRNRMEESMVLFRLIATKHFADTPIILFLNKRDLLEEKIAQKDGLKEVFSDYAGGCDYYNALEYIQERFVTIAKQRAKRDDIQVQVTCATDIDQMTKVFASLEILVQQLNMQGSGLGALAEAAAMEKRITLDMEKQKRRDSAFLGAVESDSETFLKVVKGQPSGTN